MSVCMWRKANGSISFVWDGFFFIFPFLLCRSEPYCVCRRISCVVFAVEPETVGKWFLPCKRTDVTVLSSITRSPFSPAVISIFSTVLLVGRKKFNVWLKMRQDLCHSCTERDGTVGNKAPQNVVRSLKFHALVLQYPNTDGSGVV